MDRNLNFTVQTQCANSGRQIEFVLDSDLNITNAPEGAEPVISLTIIDTEKMKEKSIVDIF